MPIRLDPWQEEVLKYEGDLLLCTGRRVGKTYILARKGIDWMATHKNCPIVIISLTEDQAMIIMSMALNYAREAYPDLIGKGENKPTLKSLHLNGGRMIVRPVGNTGDGARGFEGGILIVDESARMHRFFWIAAKPILLTTNGQIWMGSTPAGKEGYFWEKYDETVNRKNPDARFKVFSISSEEAMMNREISPSWTEEQRKGAVRILEEDKKEMSKQEYMQEYMGFFIDDIISFFPTSLIESCMKIENREICPEKADTFCGCDIAGMGSDETVIISGKRIGDRIIQVDMEKTEQTRTTETTKRIKFADALWNYKKIYIDNGGIGIGVFDSLLEDHQTKRKVVGINNATKNIDNEEMPHHKTIMKEDLYINLKRLMESGNLVLFNEPEILLSLQSIICEYKDGKLKIHGRYDHITEALTRLCWCIKDKSLNIWIEYS